MENKYPPVSQNPYQNGDLGGFIFYFREKWSISKTENFFVRGAIELKFSIDNSKLTKVYGDFF